MKHLVSLTLILNVENVLCGSLAAAVENDVRNLEEDCGGGSTGMEWCPESNSCIQPWDETCPVNGETFAGSTELTCDAGRCSSGNEKCTWTMGTAEMATYYFNNLDGVFVVPEGCSLNCNGCELASDDDDTSVVGVANPASVNCENVNGTLTSLYEEDGGEYAVCIFDDGSACEEWVLLREDCEKGSMLIFETYCANNGGVLTYTTLDSDVNREYRICTIGDSQCEENSYYSGDCANGDQDATTNVPTPSLAFDDDGYGCGGGSTGMEWCPESNSCIQPWAEICPVNGETFAGSTELTCDAGRCSSGNEKCTYTIGTAELATYYFNNLDGDFIVPEGCTLNCNGCELAKIDVGIMGDSSASSGSVKSILFVVLSFQMIWHLS
jgi:putative hemolysin